MATLCKSTMRLSIALGLATLLWSENTVHAQPRPASSRTVMALLEQKIDSKGFQQPMNFKEWLSIVPEAFERKMELSFLVDTNAFHAEMSKTGEIYEAPIEFPPFPKQMPFATALRIVLSQLPGNATFLIRNGMIEITTQTQADIHKLLRQRVHADFDKKPLAAALAEISDRTGISVVVDPKAAGKMQSPVTAFFRNDVSAATALRLLAEMAELKAAVLSSGVYVTTPAAADRLRKEPGWHTEASPPAKHRNNPF